MKETLGWSPDGTAPENRANHQKHPGQGGVKSALTRRPYDGVQREQHLKMELTTKNTQGGVKCTLVAFPPNGAVQGQVKLDADSTMKKGCKSKLWNPMVGYKNMTGKSGTCNRVGAWIVT
eukprot:14480056-Ditylum_brightwellii.AAC.1